jgi:hypothetical protein
MDLYQHQKDIIKDSPDKKGLFLGTGSGKTRTALCLAKGKTLVICPKTQKEDENWERELKKMGAELELVVISKETFRRDWKTIGYFNTVIVDEAHTVLGVTPNVKYKNKKPYPKTSQLFEALQGYIDMHNPEKIYLATATIVKNPFTVWGAGVILGEWSSGTECFYKFRDIYYFKIPMGRREVWVPKRDQETKVRLAGVVNRLGYVGQLSDYFDVPHQTFKNELIEVSTKQKEMMKQAVLEYPEPLVAIGKINQIENGVLAGDEFNAPESFPNGKQDKIIDYSYQFPKMIVFCRYTRQIEDLEKALNKEGKSVYTMTGQTKDRGELIEKLNNSDEYVFIVQAQISAGWELPECPVMVFASRTYSIVDYEQAKGRILRANNLKKNLYINLISKSKVDLAIHSALVNKRDFNDKMYEYEKERSSIWIGDKKLD